jgi:hypothetical protein
MNNRTALAYVAPILIASFISCQQSPSSPNREVSLLAPSLDADAKGEGAKPIRILSGQLIWDRATGAFPIEVKGTHGLRLDLLVRDHIAFFLPKLECEPCEPRGRVGLDAQFIDTALSGSARLQGKTYQLGQDVSDARVAFYSTGEGVVMPPVTEGQTLELTAPFEVTGTLFLPAGPGETIAHPFAGDGVATLHFAARLLAPGLPAWYSTRAVYDFH